MIYHIINDLVTFPCTKPIEQNFRNLLSTTTTFLLILLLQLLLSSFLPGNMNVCIGIFSQCNSANAPVPKNFKFFHNIQSTSCYVARNCCDGNITVVINFVSKWFFLRGISNKRGGFICTKEFVIEARIGLREFSQGSECVR